MVNVGKSTSPMDAMGMGFDASTTFGPWIGGIGATWLPRVVGYGRSSIPQPTGRWWFQIHSSNLT